MQCAATDQGKLRGEGPAAAFLSSSPLPDGPRKWVALHVFPKGTDPATICESNFPGPKNKNEYVLGLDLPYDGELKLGPAVSAGSPSVSYLSKSDDGNVTGAAVEPTQYLPQENRTGSGWSKAPAAHGGLAWRRNRARLHQ